jgi:hypothetical protein
MDGPPLSPTSVQDVGVHWRKERTISIVILGIDPGKNSCSVVGPDDGGRVVVRRRMRRDGVIAFAAGLTPYPMAMEACFGAHHMGRALAAPGHEVRLMVHRDRGASGAA